MFSQNMRTNILYWLNVATPAEERQGRHWYENALADCQRNLKETDVPLEEFVAVVAILSPRMRWSNNLKAAVSLINHGPDYPTPAYRRNRVIATKFLLSGDYSLINGPKVNAFFHTIMDPWYEEPVLDSWALRAAGVFDNMRKLRVNEREAISVTYKEIAADYGWPVSHIQAVTWVAVRNRWVNRNGVRSLLGEYR